MCVRERSNAQVKRAVIGKVCVLAYVLQPSVRPNQSTTSKVAYFKRKYAEEEDVQGGLHGYLQKHLILREERSCILRLSLQKLRFLDDPEAYLRRSVLINNLLRKIHLDEGQRERDRQRNEEVEEKGPASQRLFYTGRKKLKVVVAECCSQPFGLQDLQPYRLLQYTTSPALCPCGLAGCPALPPPDHGPPILLYQLSDN